MRAGDSDCGPEGRGFESPRSPQIPPSFTSGFAVPSSPVWSAVGSVAHRLFTAPSPGAASSPRMSRATALAARSSMPGRRSAIRPGEHQPGVPPARPGHESRLGLAGAVLAQCRRRRRVQGQPSLALERLGLGGVDPVAHGHTRLGDLDLSSPEVDVAPAQPGHLTPAHPGRGEQHPRGEQPVGAHVGKGTSGAAPGSRPASMGR